MIDYSMMVKVKDGVIYFEPVPPFLVASQVPIDQIADLTYLGLPDYVGFGWWPVIDESPVLSQFQRYTSEAVYTLVPERTAVTLVRGVENWTQQEIADWKAAQVLPASYFEYRMRLSADERVAIELAGIDAPAGTEAERLAAAKVRVFERDLSLAAPINLNAPWVHEGLAMYEASGLLAAGRSSIIIWNGEEP